ncbi:MAG TPA: cysteine desulfurase-like protein [Pyrinomonadaceae bacterium]|jgi:cysteine desulfurase family protein (TIGR01976 family)|nr:cysteine desulfurase-like protein [Pyrinomonadaceae bacterium]
MTNPQPQGAPRVAPVAEIRSHFPALEREHEGRPVAYFDGPGGTQVPRAVGDAVLDYLYHHNANTHWEYPTSAETDAALDAARRTFAEFFNSSHEEIAFGANMTALTLHLSRALGRRFSPGDEIVVTELDHHANVDPWRELARDRGLNVRTVPLITETGQLDWDAYARLLNERTRLVAVGAASNALGTINDVKTATRLAHECGALVFVDAVHYVPHALADVRAWGCDFLACSAYKFNGPHVGILYGKFDLLQSLEFHRLRPAPDYAPENAESGTLNHEGIVGAAAAVDFLASLSNAGGPRRERLASAFDGLHARSSRHFKILWDGLSDIEGVRLYGAPPGAARTPTLAFTVEGVASSEVARRLARRAVFVSHGDFYAQTVVERLGLSTEGLVRAGCAVYTTDEEVARLVEGVRAIRRG